MASDQFSPQTAKDRAVAWMVRRHSGAWSDADQRALEHWLAQDARHGEAYRRVERLWTGLDGLRPLAARELNAGTGMRRLRQWRGLLRKPALAGLALASVASLLFFGEGRLWNQPETFHTVKGEHRTVTLSDGSRIDLNTDTDLTVSFTAGRRGAEMRRGEALFTVVHDPERPFEVVIGEERIRDLGTVFDVYRNGDAVTVAVVEGAVRVDGSGLPAQWDLSAGQRLALKPGAAAEETRFDPATDLAWRNGQLVFRGAKLGEMLTELGRYHRTDLVVTDPRLNDLRITGTFATTDLQLVLDGLRAMLPVQVTQTDGQRILIQPLNSTNGKK